MSHKAFPVFCLLALLAACNNTAESEADSAARKDQELRLNHIQNVGTHNSYHTDPVGEPVVSVIEQKYPWFDRTHYLYTFEPLSVQLDQQGIRHFELDIYADYEGGRFNKSPINGAAKRAVRRRIPELDEPGFKVLHMPQLDPNSTCWTLIACLQEIKGWSDAHPHHQPLLIIIEVKDTDFLRVAPHLRFTRFTDRDFAALDSEILSVFPRQQIITPDDVQGAYETLEGAVLAGNWPTLAESRGKVLFTQYHGPPQLDTRGKLLFPQVRPGNPAAAILIVEDLAKDGAKIAEWVKQGYIVRTRTGRDLQEMINNDYAKFELALKSGVHFISTDAPVPNALNPEFVIRIPGGTPARCNPITAPAWCRPSDIENPDAL